MTDQKPITCIEREIGDTVLEPWDWQPCKVITSGDVLEHVVFKHKREGTPIIKLDSDRYIEVSTGEIKEFVHAETKADAASNVQETLARLRRIINANCTDPERIRWVTLTYRQENGQPMTDPKRVQRDYEELWRRLKTYCKRKEYGIPEYITVMEPQGSGAWHLHCVWIWQTKAPIIPKNADALKLLKLPDDEPTLESMWRQGFVQIKSCANCDNLGAYFSAYLADMSTDELAAAAGSPGILSTIDPETIKQKTVSDGSTKKYIKGARLKFYPPGLNIYRCSRGIKRPSEEWMSYEEAKKTLPVGARSTFKKHVSVITYETEGAPGKEAASVTTIYYNTKKR